MAELQAVDCEHGFHLPLVAREPVQHDGCVNVDHVCPACGGIEYTTSWTQAAWDAELEKARKKKPSVAARVVEPEGPGPAGDAGAPAKAPTKPRENPE